MAGAYDEPREALVTEPPTAGGHRPIDFYQDQPMPMSSEDASKIQAQLQARLKEQKKKKFRERHRKYLK